MLESIERRDADLDSEEDGEHVAGGRSPDVVPALDVAYGAPRSSSRTFDEEPITRPPLPFVDLLRAFEDLPRLPPIDLAKNSPPASSGTPADPRPSVWSP